MASAQLPPPAAPAVERRASKILLTDEVDPRDLVKDGNTKTLGNWIIAEETDANWTDKKGRSLVHYACELGKHAVLVYLHESHNADLMLQDRDGCTPLHHAASNDQIDCIKFCMAKGAPVDTKDNSGKTARDLASKAGAEAFQTYRNEEIAKHGLIHVEHEEKTNARVVRERHSLTLFQKGWDMARKCDFEMAAAFFKQACQNRRDTEEYEHALHLFPWIENVKMRGWVPKDNKWRSCSATFTPKQLVIRHKKGGFKGLYTSEKEQHYDWHEGMKMQVTPDGLSVSLDLGDGDQIVNFPAPFNARRILRLLHFYTGTEEAKHDPGPVIYPGPDDDDDISD